MHGISLLLCGYMCVYVCIDKIMLLTVEETNVDNLIYNGNPLWILSLQLIVGVNGE